MKVFERVVTTLSAIFQREPWWAEFWSAVTLIWWVSLSWLSNDDLSVWPSMQVLLRLGDDDFWHLVGFMLATAQLAFLLSNQRLFRWVAALLMCWLWAVLTVGVWAATPWAPAVAVYAGWCGVNVFSILRLLRPFP